MARPERQFSAGLMQKIKAEIETAPERRDPARDDGI
jgi:hypothetical protein